MALSIAQNPNTLELIDDGVIYSIATSDFKTTSGTKAAIKIEITDYPINDDQFTISFGDTSITFTIIAYTETPNGYQLRGKKPSHANAGEWLADALTEITANYYINRYYTTTVTSVGGDFLELEAKDIGAEYTITLNESKTWLNEDTNTAGTSDVYADQFKILVSLYHKDQTLAGTFKRIIDLDASPDTDNKITVELKEILKGLATQYLPNLGGSTYVERLTNQVKEYYLKCAYQSKENPQPLGLITTTTRKVMPGGTSKLFRNEYPNFVDYFDASPNKFLTWHPNTKKINTTQREYLYWLCAETLAQGFYVEVTCYYTNGDSATFSQVKPFSFGNEYEVYSIRCDYALVSPLSHGGKTISYYDVWLADESDGKEITEKKRFIVDQNKAHNELIVGFFNGLGVLEVARFTGELSKSEEVSAEYFDTQIEIDSNFEDPNFIRANISVGKQLAINSGLLTTQHKLWASDFISSTDYYLLLNDEWVPCKIRNTQILDVKKAQTFSFSATLSINYQDQHVANDYINRYL